MNRVSRSCVGGVFLEPLSMKGFIPPQVQYHQLQQRKLASLKNFVAARAVVERLT
jgi:hypothetical protein